MAIDFGGEVPLRHIVICEPADETAAGSLSPIYLRRAGGSLATDSKSASLSWLSLKPAQPQHSNRRHGDGGERPLENDANRSDAGNGEQARGERLSRRAK